MDVRHLSGRTITGAILVLLGILFLLSTLGVTDKGTIAKWTPSLFILLGIWRLFAGGFRDVTGPVLLIGVALFVQLVLLGFDAGTWWPLILIVLGVLALLGGLGPRHRAPPSATAPDVDLVAVLSGAQRRVTSTDFHGGRVTAFLGGVDLDLRDATLAERPATLDVSVTLGGLDLKVPSEWEVRIDATALLGGVSDERRRAGPSEGPPHLVITGFVLLGGISVKD